MMKKAVSLLLCAALALSLSGCGQAAAGSDASAVSASAVASAVEASAVSAAASTTESAANAQTEVGSIYESESETAGFLFEETAPGQVTITGYQGKSEQLTIPETLNGSTVTAIGDYAFECNTDLQVLTIPAGVTAIGSGAFSGCSSLTSITLSEGLETVGAGAFMYCTKLPAITIPDSVIALGAFTFAGCSVLADVVLGAGLTALPDRLFYRCQALAQLPVPENITSIGKRTFSYCTALTEIDLPDSVQSVGPYAFENCEALQKASLATGTLSEGLFHGCYSLTALDCGDSLQKICTGALQGTNVDFSEIPASVTEIEAGAFQDDHTISSFTVADGNTAFTAVDGVLYTADMTRLVCMPCGTTMNELAIPDTVTEIDAYGLYAADGLQSVTLPSGLQEIGTYAFCYTNITSLEIPEGVTTLAPHVLDSCYALTSLSLPDTLTTIEADALANCTALTALTLPVSLQAITASAFLNDDELQLSPSEAGGAIAVTDGAIYLNGCLVSYPNHAETEAFAIPDGTTAIADGVFAENRNLKEITVPDSVTEIGENVFRSSVYLLAAEDSYARTYARAHSIGCFSTSPELKDHSVTLAGDESTIFTIPEAYGDDIVYTSSDETIALVDDSGTITGIGKGTCSVYASIGSTIIPCSVTVTSTGTANASDTFDRSRYLLLSGDEAAVNTWADAYKKANSDLSFRSEDHVYTAMYKGAILDEFKPMVASQTELAAENTDTTAYGDDYQAMYGMAAHGCETELSRFHQTDDIVLMTGIYDYQLTEAIGTEDHSLTEVRKHIGEEFTLGTLVSTSLSSGVACSFGDTVFIIYATKEAMDEVGCCYIDGFFGSNEEEILMCSGAHYRILGAGTMEAPAEEGQEGVEYRNYVEIELLGKAASND